MQIILAAPAVPFPARARRRPTASCWAACRPASASAQTYQSALALVRLRRLSSEPGVPVGGVRQHLVDDHLEAERVRPLDAAHRNRRAFRTSDRRPVVGDVVAEILHRRGEEGRQPDGVDAEGGDIVQPRGDAREVADSVAVRVGEAARIDLVDHRAPPPVGAGGRLVLAKQLRLDVHTSLPARQGAVQISSGLADLNALVLGIRAAARTRRTASETFRTIDQPSPAGVRRQSRHPMQARSFCKSLHCKKHSAC